MTCARLVWLVGWLAWLAQAKAGVPSRLAKPALSQLFHPVRPCFGIDATCTAENDAWMFGDAARVKRYVLSADKSLQTLDTGEKLTHKLVDPAKVI